MSSDFFDYDRCNRQFCEGRLKDGVVLYRVASLSHWHREHLLTGNGALNSGSKGRFHHKFQRASYCSNNALLAMSEVLFHMHAKLLDRIAEREAFRRIQECCCFEGKLVVFSLEEVPELVFVDTKAVRADYDARIAGTTVVSPKRSYAPMQDLGQQLREEKKRGAIYPSARHSRDEAYVLFNDETGSIREDPYIGIDLNLRLIGEEQEIGERPQEFDPFEEKAHPTMAFYEFDKDDWNSLGDRTLLKPTIPRMGYVDIVRRPYREYPQRAVLSAAGEGL